MWLGLVRDVTAGAASFTALPGSVEVHVQALPEDEEPNTGELWLRGPTVMPQPYVGLSDEVPAGGIQSDVLLILSVVTTCHWCFVYFALLF